MTSIILAKIFGIYMLTVGISLFLNPSRFREFYKNFFENQGLLLTGGIIALLFGATVVSFHNVWEWNWTVLITILGWWAIIKGAGLLALPNFANFFRPILELENMGYRWIGLLFALLGLFFCYQGWL